MSVVVTLKDGTEVLIRPMRADDVDRSFGFFQSLPEDDRAYLRRDVTRRDVVEERIRAMKSGHVKRLAAVDAERIVAEGALELEGEGWLEHQGELRLIVARSHQRKGLGARMARELYRLAAQLKLEQVVVKVMGPQVAARSIFRRLGFCEEILLPEHVVDRDGSKQDLVLMRCHLQALWHELEGYFADTDREP